MTKPKRFGQFWKDIKNFNRSGQGHKGQKIQNQIKDWNIYNNGTICININPTVYKTGGCYLNWEPTAINVNAIWENDIIIKLKIVKDSYPIRTVQNVLVWSKQCLRANELAAKKGYFWEQASLYLLEYL